MELEGAFFETDDYKKLKKKVGKGSFGEVVLVENQKDKKIYAAKIINVGQMFSGKEQNQFIRESVILNKLDHPAIVKFYGINLHNFVDPTSQDGIMLEPTILTEYLSNGSLDVILQNERRSIAHPDWNATKKYICILGICHAMRYLHTNNIIHRDLKPANILLDEDLYPRVCDFGLSRCFSDVLARSMQKMSKGIGTPLYMSPELLDNNEEKFGFGIDVYAFAILVYEIVSGKEPFAVDGKPIALTKLVSNVMSGKRPEFTDGITKKMRKLLNRCWSQDPQERPSFDVVFSEISKDFSYLDEDVNEDEINEYLRLLEEDGNEVEKTINENKIEMHSDYDFVELKKKIENEQKIYVDIIKKIVENHGEIQNIYDKYKGNILHLACRSGNLELVKYIISLNKIDITSKTIPIYDLFHSKHHKFMAFQTS